jgi:acyl carrier protein phosphodiesterase
MNYLAHLHLSGDEPLVMVGNFMADAVKGRDLSAHHPDVQRGIRMHRRIDSFTDQHAATAIGRQRLRAHCGKYAGVALDLFYDHLLADEWSLYDDRPLQQYAEACYALLQREQFRMPDRIQHMLPYMVRGDWLTSYASIDGLGQALYGLSVRAYKADALAGAEAVLVAHIAVYRTEFHTFLAELKDHLRDHG